MAADELFPRLAAPDAHPALSVDGRTLTYAQLAAACDAHAAMLTKAGVRNGDRVAIWTHPGLETAAALVGNAMAGVVSVPINASVGERELEHIMRDSRPRLVLALDPPAVAARTPEIRVESIARTEPGSAHSRPLRREVDDRELLVLYTSGTTGAPKGAVLTTRNVASNVSALAAAWAWTDRDVLVHALPLFHVHGLALGLFGTLRAGASLRWHGRFAPEAIAREFEHGASMLFAVPTMYHRIAEFAERDVDAARPFRNARLLVSGSAALPVREHVRLERALGQRVVERYGLTETLINCAVRHDGDRRAGYVGAGVDGIAVRLVDDARTVLDASDDATIGEIAVRGPNVFAGYLNRADATAAVCDADGWFYTGDLATRAADGYLRIVGRRATDLIKTGGYKVGAGEIEAALLEHPSVREAAVIAVPDDDLGERIVAYVVPSESRAADASLATALTDHVARLLAPHKRPRIVRFVDELPRNAMGKVLKSALQSREPG